MPTSTDLYDRNRNRSHNGMGQEQTTMGLNIRSNPEMSIFHCHFKENMTLGMGRSLNLQFQSSRKSVFFPIMSIVNGRIFLKFHTRQSFLYDQRIEIGSLNQPAHSDLVLETDSSLIGHYSKITLNSSQIYFGLK